jgi:hypothetical protein
MESPRPDSDTRTLGVGVDARAGGNACPATSSA